MHARWRIAVTLLAAFPTIISTAGSAGEDLTSGRESWPNPVHVYEDDNALITCVVRDVGNNTVIWKREDADTRRWRILTAGHDRVTPDKRIEILHDDGGDVWVLAIKDVKSNDSGVYACEVNSNPVVRTLHKLSVLSRNLQPPPTVLTDVDEVTFATMREHNYTDCCVASNVSTGCLGFCNIQSILEGNTGQDPEHCEADFPAIVRCMADMRNHVPCCIDEGVPDICQDVCRGEYTMITDNIKTHFSCSAYTEQTLACIVEGIEILPSAPLDIEVMPLTDKSLNISWMPPFDNAHTVTKYVVNVTMLKSFDPSSIDSPNAESSNNSSQSVITPHSVQVKVNKEEQSIVIDGLTPLTMYEITVIAKNIHGSSLPSHPVRSLTLIPGQSRQKSGKAPPKLPDVRGCCYEKGVTHTTCLDKLCGMNSTVVAAVTDLMICAPWAEQTFSCLANGIDHRPCCRARGLPELCQELCSGNVTELNFNYFRCVKYMGVYTNCLMQGYGVLPSAPTKLRLTNIDIDFAIVHWNEPTTLSETIHSYVLYYRYLEDSDYTIVRNVHPPHILTSLKSDSLYEVYVTAVNDHGAGEPSQRVVFDTLSKLREKEVEDSINDYNVTQCCIEAGLSSVCLPVCTYDASMSKMKELATVCAEELPKLIRCGAGGRNHRGCCKRRGVPNTCLPLCSGVVVDSVIVTATNCIPYIGNIVQCFEEGTGLLPGPVEELHAVHVTENDVTIRWEPPKDSNVTDYVIHYKIADNTSIHETSLKLDNQKNTTSTTYTITGLESNALYDVFVVSRNAHGTSLPSSVLRVKATATNVTGKGIAGVTSPPHSLAVVVHSATYVTISWQPPEFSLPSEQLTYKLFYKPGSENTFTMFETSVTTYILKNLTPNTQYFIYVIAVSKKGSSLPSETLIAWTDPAYPAFVEPPTVHPINLVVEGSSMTILCIAMGVPMPTISLYISGRLVRQEVTRHMVTVIYNVTRDMDHISCYADNGFGTPMEARRRIVISHMPHLTASGITMAAHGDTVSLECIVDAHPEPKMMFWRDYSMRVPVIRGPKYDVTTRRVQDEGDKWIMTLTIKQISDEDGGDYYCHAENAFGNATQPVSVRIRNVAAVNNVTQCCMEHNVSSTCMDACSFYLDIDAVIDKPQCINDFDKLMRCAADGSDHRSCCANAGVERGCLDWCRGEPLFLQDNKFCLVSYTKTIMSCFREGRDKLPGPPQNVRVEHRDLHSVIIHWDIPVKNPHTVEMYRVFWRQSGVRTIPQKNDTKVTSLILTGLKEGVVYECVVKAGNSMGTSHLTDPVKFTTDDKYITSSASLGDEHSQIGVAVGILLALVLVAGIVVAAVWFIRTRNLLGLKSNGNVAFENPSYLREVNMDHMQISQSGDNVLANGSTANGTAMQHQPGWKHEPLHVPASSEVPPSLYEELKLGHDGVGFKRLKP